MIKGPAANLCLEKWSPRNTLQLTCHGALAQIGTYLYYLLFTYTVGDVKTTYLHTYTIVISVDVKDLERREGGKKQKEKRKRIQLGKGC